MTAATVQTSPPEQAPSVPATPPAGWRRVLAAGAITATALTFVAAIGMLETFDQRLLVDPLLSLGFALFLGLAAIAGYAVSAPRAAAGVPPPPHGPLDLVRAVAVGLIGAVGPALLIVALGSDADLRSAFPNLSPVLRDLMTLGMGPGAGTAALAALIVGASVFGGAFHLAPQRVRRAVVIGLEWVVIASLLELVARQLLGNLGLSTLHRALYVPNSGLRISAAVVVFVLAAGLAFRLQGVGAKLKQFTAAQTQDSRAKTALVGVVAVVALVVGPMLVGSLVNELLVNVGLFMLMALGLNIVVGYAGLLDLGYVAFFAVGAYSMSVLTSPLSPQMAPMLNWWVALPIVVGCAALAGVFVGTPVIRMRGDYLAIVTLGFGEIVRILVLSDWLAPVFGGAQGIQRIPGVDFGAFEVRGVNPQAMFYLTAVFVLIVAYSSWRLQNSRVGRAWAAMREDEITAEVMGVDTVRAKLMAFVAGAICASFAGALFVAKVGSVFPNSFELLVSIIILVVVIVGGMGHIPGVMVGAIVLIGILGGPRQPGLLQEFGQYKLLLYGALLVYMMLERPEGLVPSVRRTRELHQEEFQQDAWFDKQGRLIDDPADLSSSGASQGSES